MASSRTLRVTKDEWTFFGTLLPYLAMVMGSFLTLMLGLATRAGIMIQHNASGTDFTDASKGVTWVIIISCLILSAISWRLFSQRRAQFIAFHATVTVILVHLWLIMAVWEDKGDWVFGAPTFYAFFYGSIVVALSWCIRRWALRDEEFKDDESENPFEAAGLGSAKIDGYNTRDVAGGRRFRLKLPIGKTIEDAKNRRIAIAQIAGKPRSLVHVSETESGIEGQVDVLILDDNPFDEKALWSSATLAGQSIAEPIQYATYDTGERPDLYIAGKNGASSQHFLTMGMSGAGKSKAWQVIYGTVLNRREVSVIFGDPAKGMQTGGPLAGGLEWFATTEEECLAQIEGVIRAIPERTDFLTARGYDHWVPGCGLNFLIFHLEEAARFAKVDDLIELIEAARSAGICIVLSLQRATNDRLKTSARYNLGGNMCFGVKMKADAKFGLSEYAIEAGAEPHMWQDKKPGYHYLEAHGIDSNMVGHPLVTDWINISKLEKEVDKGAPIRTALDNVTASALGPVYDAYRRKVSEGLTNWQALRRNRGFDNDTMELGKTVQEELPFNVESNQSDNGDSQARVPLGFNTPVEETQAYRQHVRDIIVSFKDNGKQSFTLKEIKLAGFTGRGDSWLSKNLASLVKEGFISYNKESRFYTIS